MIIRNWMRKDPITIHSDMLASEALSVFAQCGLPFIPVVDDGRLRGILARRDLREAASCVTAAESIHELNYFNTRLKVKDLMVRKPETLSANDTVETALSKGKKFGRSFFPILDGDRLTGTVSYLDIFDSLYQILGIEEEIAGVSLECGRQGGERMAVEVVEAVAAAGGILHSLFNLKDPQSGKQRLVVRFKAPDPDAVIQAVEASRYQIIERVATP